MDVALGSALGNMANLVPLSQRADFLPLEENLERRGWGPVIESVLEHLAETKELVTAGDQQGISRESV